MLNKDIEFCVEDDQGIKHNCYILAEFSNNDKNYVIYEEEDSDSGNATYDTVNPEDVEDMADAVNALAQAVAALQEQTNNMASVDFETLNQAIQTLDETANSLESTAGRISAIFG